MILVTGVTRMNALAAPAGFLAPNAQALAPYRRNASALDANGLGGVGGMLGQLGGKLVRGELGDATEAAVAHISDLGRSFLQRFQESGATSGSLDLHLDLEALGLKVDGSGARSAEAHSLSVDMHVEATRGVIQTEHGEVHFERIELSFSIEETHVEMRESKPGGGRELLDGLKGLASLLDEATRESPAAGLDLDQLRELLADHAEQLDRLLEQIGRGFERMARRQRGDEEAAVEAYAEQTVVRLEALRFVRAAPVEAAPTVADAAVSAA
jgi:hypothetical protein